MVGVRERLETRDLVCKVAVASEVCPVGRGPLSFGGRGYVVRTVPAGFFIRLWCL